MNFVRVLLALFIACLWQTDASAAWHRAESAHFIFYGDEKPERLKDNIERLERFDGLLRRLTGIPQNDGSMKLTIYVVPSIASVQKSYGADSGNVAGYYTANPAGALAVVPRGGFGAEVSPDTVLFHEYAHHLMRHHFPVAYPAWYIEGFAEYLSTAVFKDDKAHVGLSAKHRAYDLILGNKVPIKVLLQSQVGELRSDFRGNFYGRSWLLVHYLAFTPGMSKKQADYLALINTGVPALKAAEQSFGDLDALDRKLTAYQNARTLSYLAIHDPKPVGNAITVTPLAKDESTAMMLRIQLSRGTADKERKDIADRLEGLLQKNPGSPAILTLLAEARLDLEDFDAAEKAADGALAVEPKNTRALLWKGLAQTNRLDKAAKQADAAAWKAARSWIVKANRSNPEDPLPLYGYYLSFHREGEMPPRSAFDGLYKAITLLPQVDEFRLPFALWLVEEKDYGSAAKILRPIANEPHGNAFGDGVRRAIDKLDAVAKTKDATISATDVMALISSDTTEPK